MWGCGVWFVVMFFFSLLSFGFLFLFWNCYFFSIREPFWSSNKNTPSLIWDRFVTELEVLIHSLVLWIHPILWFAALRDPLTWEFMMEVVSSRPALFSDQELFMSWCRQRGTYSGQASRKTQWAGVTTSPFFASVRVFVFINFTWVLNSHPSYSTHSFVVRLCVKSRGSTVDPWSPDDKLAFVKFLPCGYLMQTGVTLSVFYCLNSAWNKCIAKGLEGPGLQHVCVHSSFIPHTASFVCLDAINNINMFNMFISYYSGELKCIFVVPRWCLCTTYKQQHKQNWNVMACKIETKPEII